MAAKRSPQATRASAPRRADLPFWVWLLCGILIGLGLAAVILFKGWAPKLRETEPAPTPAPTTAPTATTTTAKPRFDFYSVLPEMEVVVPDEEIKSASAKPSPAAPAGAERKRLVLQAGSFRNQSDADALKAKLALSGYRAQVTPVSVNGVDWFRVRLGPYADLGELDHAREALKSSGIEAIALRENG
ncbi:MAG: SPOR domain-containing protein [Lysobacterales bacterium CG02_land_8_20_14_3_00_62_12]|nr:MAG: SPOR domain-containing protein [Xanthomonadales bacterium CG02_land_8_20_14_3_00_62_12]